MHLRLRVPTRHSYPFPILPKYPRSNPVKHQFQLPLRLKKDNRSTYAGHPKVMATAARILFPFPYPKSLYMTGANSGNPNPARERRHDTAASADAAWRVKLSTTYVWMAWKLRIIPEPTHAMPWSGFSTPASIHYEKGGGRYTPHPSRSNAVGSVQPIPRARARMVKGTSRGTWTVT